MDMKRREGESVSAFLYRFTKKVRQSGILLEAKKRRFRTRPASRLKKRLSALHKAFKTKEAERARKAI